MIWCDDMVVIWLCGVMMCDDMIWCDVIRVLICDDMVVRYHLLHQIKCDIKNLRSIIFSWKQIPILAFDVLKEITECVIDRWDFLGSLWCVLDHWWWATARWGWATMVI